jgi:pimeloyl-ACP methyl ester carboxylesterase
MKLSAPLLASLCLLATLQAPAQSQAQAQAQAPAIARSVRNGYVDDRFGQLHFTMATPQIPKSARRTPVVMFHQTVNASIESRPLFDELAKDRVVIAIDTPGYGNSDGPAQPITIEEYAAAIAEGLRGLGYGPRNPLDVFGLHTGALIAAELAIAEPKTVRRAVLSGVYVVPEERWKKALATLPPYKSSAEYFDWAVGILPRLRQYAQERGIPDADWGRITVESLRPLLRREYGHEAAFRYAARAPQRLPKLTQPVLLLALGDSLRQPTLDSRPLFRDARVADLPQYLDGAYYPDVGPIAGALRGFLD